jgi:hypothetical protein
VTAHRAGLTVVSRHALPDLVRWSLPNFLPGLASTRDPHDLQLLSSWDYRCEDPLPSLEGSYAHHYTTNASLEQYLSYVNNCWSQMVGTGFIKYFSLGSAEQSYTTNWVDLGVN